MKKVISVALVAILIVTTALTFTGCIFNTGAEKEVYGVYGVDRMFYNSYDGKTYNYADKFDYYLLVLYKGGESEKTGKVISAAKKPRTTFTSRWNSTRKKARS